MSRFTINRRSAMLGGAVLLGGCTGGAVASDDTAAAASSDDGDAPEQFEVEVLDDRMAGIAAPDAVATVIASGFAWPEGPTWDQKRDMLYWSDIPNNRIHSWDAESGLGLWRAQAGSIPAPEGINAGTNGLLYLPEEDAMLVCDQSSRAIVKYDLANGGDPTVIVGGPDDRPFNSPNDLIMDSEGGLYFTDPSYGLIENLESPLRKRDFNGIYYVPPGGDGSDAVLIEDGISEPNGIALSPDEQHLYIGVSDNEAAHLWRFVKDGAGWVRDADPWYDMMPHKEGGVPGHVDGMAAAQDGTIFTSGPGGIYIISPQAELLGRVTTGNPTSNCCFGEDGKTLFITSDNVVLRLPLLLSGMGF